MAPVKKEIELKPATERGEATRARVIEAAYALFQKKGFHGASMRDIAEEAGVAVGGIYNHFHDKGELFAAVLDAHHPYHSLIPAIQEVQADSVESYIRQAARLVYDSLTAAQAQVLPILFVELVEFQGRHIRQLVGQLGPEVWKHLGARFGRMQGRLRPLALPLVFRAFLCLIIGMVLSEMVVKDSPLFKPLKINWLEGVVDIFLHGVMEREEA
jgi:AcrR family transcriptional regulator